MPLGHNRQEGVVDYLMITKNRLVLASTPHESFFHLGQKDTFSKFIRSIFRGAINLIHQGHMPLMPHGWTRLCYQTIIN